MSPRNVAITTLVVLLAAAPVHARQTAMETPADGRVMGVVVDENTGSPIGAALVFLSDGRFTETDESGHFLFRHVRPGEHRIAAVTHGCALVQGEFDLQAGEDALLQIEVDAPWSRKGETSSRSGGSRVIEGEDLRGMGNRSVLEALTLLMPNTFEVKGHALALRARGASAHRVTEPLLVIDGMRARGNVAQVLAGMAAEGVSRIELHLGHAASWEFQPGGGPAVLEITTRTRANAGAELDSRRSPESCVNWSSF